MSCFWKTFEVLFQMFPFEYVAPLLYKFFAVKNLETLNAFRCVAAGGSAFVMHQSRHGLIDNLIAKRADTEAEIDVFVVSRCVTPIKTTELLKKILSYEQRCGRTIVNFPSEIEAPIIR